MSLKVPASMVLWIVSLTGIPLVSVHDSAGVAEATKAR